MVDAFAVALLLFSVVPLLRFLVVPVLRWMRMRMSRNPPAVVKMITIPLWSSLVVPIPQLLETSLCLRGAVVLTPCGGLVLRRLVGGARHDMYSLRQNPIVKPHSSVPT